jgi:hypothetical protein
MFVVAAFAPNGVVARMMAGTISAPAIAQMAHMVSSPQFFLAAKEPGGNVRLKSLFAERVFHARHPIEYGFTRRVVNKVRHKIPMPLKLKARTGGHIHQ